MKIQDVKIDGFGVWSGLSLSELDPGVTVFYGPNEAGKTTLLQFVRTVLFGFSPPRRARYLPPLAGGAAGGSLAVAASQGRYEVVRHDTGRDSACGELRVVTAEGRTHKGHFLSTLLCGIDESIFNNVFAVGLREIQELGALSDSGAGTLLYRLTTGLDRVSLADVMRELSASRNRLLAADEKPSQIVQLLDERDKLSAEIEQLRSQTRHYAQLAEERERISLEVDQAHSEQSELERGCRLVEIAVSVRERWQQRLEIDRQLARLADVAPLAPGVIEEFDALKARLATRAAELTAWKRERAELAVQIAHLHVNDALWRHAPRIEALAEQQDWAASVEADCERLQIELIELEEKHTSAHKPSSVKGDKKESAKKEPVRPSVHIHAQTLAKLRPLARTVVAANRRLKKVKAEAREAAEKTESLAAEIRHALGDRPNKELAAAIDQAGETVAQLRRRAQIDERLDQMTRQRRELVDQSHTLLDRQLMPLRVIASLGSVFVFGIMLVLGAAFLGSSFLGPAGWTVAVLGLMATIVAIIARFVYERASTSELEACRHQVAMLDAQLSHATEERDQLDAKLPRGGGPILTRLQNAEKDLAALEELLPIDARREGAEQEAALVRPRVKAAREQFENARRRWQQALAAAGVRKDVMPKHLKQLTVDHKAIDELAERIERCRAELEERQRELGGFRGRLAKLLADVHLKPAGERSADSIRQLQQELHDQESRVARRDHLRGRAVELGRKGKTELRELRRDKRRRAELLRSAQASDEQQLRRRAAEHARAERLRGDRQRLTHEITVALGPQNSEEMLAEHFSRIEPAQQEKYGHELTQRRHAAQGRLQKLLEQRGQLNQQLKQLAADRRLPAKLLDLELLDEKLREAVERWQVLAAAHRLLDAIRRTYEAEHQPETLREASGYLRDLTGGHYVRVWTPLDADVLMVDDAHGKTLSVDLLSRGTREQLFLSLRLALVSAFGRRGATLPLVLDDVLVNFDSTRVTATARLLAKFAANGFQVLVFTCHEHIAQIFHDLGMGVRELPSNAVSKPTSSRADQIDGAATDEPPAPAPESEPVEHAVELVEIQPAPATVEPVRSGPPRPKRRLKRRRAVVAHRQRREPFAGAIWHEHVADANGNGNGHDDQPPWTTAEDDEPLEPEAD